MQRFHFSLILRGQNGMRVTLVHNPKAGQGRHRKKDLMNALVKAGHRPLYQSTKKSSHEKTLKRSTDLVLAAGGDGTIEKVAYCLIDSGTPLSVLPLGTANNLARSLGFVASPEEIIARLESGKKRTFDVGLARGPWGKRFFFEGAGGGLLADYVRDAKGKGSRNKKLSKEQEMKRHVLLLRQMLHDYSARKWKMKVDDEDISDRYILWEAMNIRSVGPALYFAPRAATKDGRFDLVCVRERDRSILMKYLDARLARQKTKFPLPIRRFHDLKIASRESMIHLDDRFWPRKKEQPKGRSEIEITVRPSALVILQVHGQTKRRE